MEIDLELEAGDLATLIHVTHVITLCLHYLGVNMGIPASNIQSGLYASLAKVANLIAEKMKQKVKDVKAPSIITKHISIDSPVISDKASYVDIVIDTSKNGAPMAGAYEWGKEPYRIPPEGEKRMAFPKEKWPQYEPPPSAPNVFVFTHVMHPMIVPRPYIKPTIIENKEEVKRILARDFKVAILGSIQKVTIIE